MKKNDVQTSNEAISSFTYVKGHTRVNVVLTTSYPIVIHDRNISQQEQNKNQD